MSEQSGSNSNSEKWGLVTIGAGMAIIGVAGAAAELLDRQANASQNTGIEALLPIQDKPSSQEAVNLLDPLNLAISAGALATGLGFHMYYRKWPFHKWPKNPTKPTS